MRKSLLLIAVCAVLAVMVATISAQGPGGPGAGGPGGGRGAGGGGGRGGGGQRGPAVDISGPTPTGANGAADLPGIMNRIQALAGGRGSIATKVMAGDAAGVATDLATVQTLFMNAQTAFTKEKVGGAADMAKAAAAAAGEAMKVAKSGKVDAATTKDVTGACGGCHMMYRTKADDGSYKLKTS